MDSSTTWLRLASERLGPIDQVRPLGARTWRIRAGNRQMVAKVGPAVTDEVAGLRDLATVRGAPPVPEIVLAETGLLVTPWVPPAPPSPVHEEELGRALAALHRAPWPRWGGGSSWIGDCRVDPRSETDAAGFYGRRLTELAGRCGLEKPVAAVVSRWEHLVAPCDPALVHGDLWWGNVLWSAEGRAYVIDPSVHGGHPEEDLAMLALFGSVPDRLRRAYLEVRDLDRGWEDRVALWQLYPLLVHTVLFGGGYRAQAEAAARYYA